MTTHRAGLSVRVLAVVRGLLVGCAVMSALAPGAEAEQASQPDSPDAGRLDAGIYHTCALLTGGNVRCWGASPDGQLGYGNSATIGDNETPSSVGPVKLGRRATAIATGDYHTCALLDDRSVRCWGFGGNGRLGYGNTSNIGDAKTPDTVGPVNLGRPATAITAGGAHTCALLDDGSVRCWGFGGAGELGYGNINNVGDTPGSTPDKIGPVNLGPGRTALAISAGGRHTCAVLDDGSVRCWGEGSDGELGYGNRNRIGDNETPASGHPLNAVACPAASQCTAVDDSGQQVTFNPTTPGIPAPTKIDSAHILRGVACPSTSQCTAVDDFGQQVTFNPTTPGIPAPTKIDSARTLVGVACPSANQCTAVDGFGQQVTFNPTTPGTPTPTTIDTSPNLRAVACPSLGQCTAVDGFGQQVTFNPTTPGTPTPTTIDAGHALNAVACPSASRCTAVDDSGQQMTFNPAAPGTPTPTTIDNLAPVNLGPGRTAKAISAGGAHTCALLDNATVRCWGSGGNGQLGYANTNNIGDDELPNTVGPVDLGIGSKALAISAGGAHTCALLENGSVRCWGYGANGRLGYGNTNTIGAAETPAGLGPVDLGAGHTALAISAGQNHTCARLDDATVRCWGYGGNGRLGYCNEESIGDNEPPSSAGPVSLEPDGGGAACVSPGGSAPNFASAPGPAHSIGATKNAQKAGSDAARARGLRNCLASVTSHARREQRLAGRRSGRRRARIRRHLSSHARSGRRRCLRVFGRPPGRITGLRARTIGKTQIELHFKAAGTDGNHAPAARSYVVKQSPRPIRSARDFAGARALCKGACRFTVIRVGDKVTLTVTDLRPHTTYYYAVAGRDNVSARRGPRSHAIKARTR